MSTIDQDRLCAEARKAAANAYAPYSKFRVGAALLCTDGTIITGVNVENRSYGLTVCAERAAICTAISSGFHKFSAMAIAGLDIESPLPPCGACRQVLTEFLPADASIYFCGSNHQIRCTRLTELLPYDSLHDLGSR